MLILDHHFRDGIEPNFCCFTQLQERFSFCTHMHTHVHTDPYARVHLIMYSIVTFRQRSFKIFFLIPAKTKIS